MIKPFRFCNIWIVRRCSHRLYRSNGFKFSRATFYRRLENLKQLGLVEWRVGKARLTEKGLKLRCILNGSDSDFEEKEGRAGTFHSSHSYLTTDRNF